SRVGASLAIVGAGPAGVALADFFSARGREVHVLEEGRDLAPELAHPRRWRLLHDLRERGVVFLANARVLEVGARGLRAQLREGRETREQELPCDSVIFAGGWHADDALARGLREAGLPRVEAIGDAARVGYLEGAIHSAFHAALGI
ncbi:MAG TPA: FAD-dependent oxidoreductase, partial [Myxococcota bacterium]|nr:FAD-dependent oxidoreductase [Myxococcota bacterium]